MIPEELVQQATQRIDALLPDDELWPVEPDTIARAMLEVTEADRDRLAARLAEAQAIIAQNEAAVRWALNFVSVLDRKNPDVQQLYRHATDAWRRARAFLGENTE